MMNVLRMLQRSECFSLSAWTPVLVRAWSCRRRNPAYRIQNTVFCIRGSRVPAARGLAQQNPALSVLAVRILAFPPAVEVSVFSSF